MRGLLCPLVSTCPFGEQELLSLQSPVAWRQESTEHLSQLLGVTESGAGSISITCFHTHTFYPMGTQCHREVSDSVSVRCPRGWCYILKKKKTNPLLSRCFSCPFGSLLVTLTGRSATSRWWTWRSLWYDYSADVFAWARVLAPLS